MKEGQTLEVAPYIGWVNAVPDAMASVDLVIGGSKLSFTGVGYHDKVSMLPRFHAFSYSFQNWSNQPFAQNVGSWYWGHGRLGPYSIVWYDYLTRDGAEFVSAYAARNNQIVTASCASTSIRVRPTGQNSTYPPVHGSGTPSGFHINLDLGTEGVLNVNVSERLVVLGGEGVYARWVGNMSGIIQGSGVVWEGVALYEEFNMH